ncbi:MAG TPA: 4Fe-4S double cluster binding domain-containing protein [Defluviitaleaceae bacterium]|jgi:epoxyqueuosine reductase|nr:4Fe-4S double cluster binding domain-containing protein [Actinomycetota bacterium]HQD50767.1 4Fe-4S double cluster binding domain-containing protein [Defluviitaleaceae bacterium]
MYEAEELIAKSINNIGGKIKIVSVDILPLVREQFEKTDMNNGMLKDYFNFSLDADIKSLIIVALPSSPCYVEIEWDFGIIEADIPPVYIHRDQQLSMIKETVSNVFEHFHLKSWPVVFPKKMLAAMSSFGKYGRNNLLYIEGMGSCHRLTVFGTDMICTEEIELASDLRMDRCSKCGVCINQCQTGAIDKENIQIAVDKCLTFHNERKNPIPDWIQSDWHNSLIGCIKCQEKCPANAGLWNRKKVGEFSYDETQMIIKATAFEALDTALQNKLSELNLDRYFDVLSRNILLLLKAKNLL